MGIGDQRDYGVEALRLLSSFVRMGSNSTETKPIVVTGAAGFVGGYVVKLLRDQGRPVRAMVRSHSHAHALRALGIPTVVADIRDRAAVRECLKGASSVIHIAALFRSAGHPESTFRDINAGGTRIVFEEARDAGVQRIVHCSTVGVHGDVAQPPGVETSPLNPGDAYQRTKLEGEEIARGFFSNGDMRGIVIRPAMIYGPGDLRTLKLFSMIAQQRFMYVGKGDSYVHFIDVRDLARAFVQGLDATQIHNEVFIIAGERAVRLHELVDLISTSLEVHKPWLHLPVKPMQLLGTICETLCVPFNIEPPIFRRRVDFFTKNRWFDASKARDMLGFAPQRSWADEVQDILQWYVANGYLSVAAKGERLSSTKHVPVAPVDYATPARQIMVRSLDGNIFFWNSGAERYYGFRDSEAVGQISHELLRTEFSSPLDEINARIMAGDAWEGTLLHTRRDGRQVQVESKWMVSRGPDNDEPYVIEVNVDGSKSETSGGSHVLALPLIEYASNTPAWMMV